MTSPEGTNHRQCRDYEDVLVHGLILTGSWARRPGSASLLACSMQMVELSRWNQMTNLNACMFKTHCRTDQMTDKKVDPPWMQKSRAQTLPPRDLLQPSRPSAHTRTSKVKTVDADGMYVRFFI